MTLRGRLTAAELKLRKGKVLVIPIFIGRGNDELARVRAESALQKGARLKLIRFPVGDRAESLEEALAIIADHKKKRGEDCAIVVHGPNDMNKVLARWDPGPPKWVEELKAMYRK